MDISLTSPAGTNIDLSSDNGSSGDSYTGTMFEDNGPDGPITGGIAPFIGTYSPEEPLSTFCGENADGDWILAVCDDADGDTGTLNSFSITFASSTICSCTAATATGAVELTCPATAASIEVDITDLGSASSLIISNSLNATTVSAPAIGPYSLTGFAIGDGTVTITVADAADATCFTTFDVDIPDGCPPDNNDCGNATSVLTGQVVMGNTTFATNVEGLEACQRGGGDGDCTAGGGGTTDFTNGVWFVYTSSLPENITATTEGSAFDTELMVYQGSCGALTCVGGDDDSGAGTTSTLCWLSSATEAPVDYYIYVDGHAANSGDFEFSILATALPVELVSFEGKAMEEVNMLTWATSAEENTEWHIIERSIDGRSNWTEIGRVPAAGNSNTIQNYELKDEAPLTSGYYRLISLDYDMYMDYSDVINIKRDIVKGNIRVYPNPVAQELSIDFALVQAEDVTSTITDLTGKLISTENYQGARGDNNHTVNFNGLSNGVYFVSMISQDNKVTKRVVKN